jgi:hypothetical protein
VAQKIAVPADAVPGLEVTSFAALSAVPAPAGELVVGLEPTGLPTPVGAVANDVTPDLERTVQEPVGGDPSGFEVVCQNCGATGQATGIYCDKCGTRLSRPPDPDDIPMVVGVALDEDAPTMCKACGARRIVDGRCLDCGVSVRG